MARPQPPVPVLHLGRACPSSGTARKSSPRCSATSSSPARPEGPTSFADFAARLARERRQGWVYVDEEFEPGLVGIAAPVFDFEGRVIAALNLSAPKFRAGKALAAAGPRLVEVATELSSLLLQGSLTRVSGRTGMSDRESIRFFSDGQRLDGELWHPPSAAVLRS